jgi:hypothetical protein
MKFLRIIFNLRIVKTLKLPRLKQIPYHAKEVKIYLNFKTINYPSKMYSKKINKIMTPKLLATTLSIQNTTYLKLACLGILKIYFNRSVFEWVPF